MVMSLKMEKPLAEARGEVAYGAEFLRWYAEEAPRIAGRHGASPGGTGTRGPVGPCYCITPWNFPIAMATRKVAPAVAAGCTAVLKPPALPLLTTLLLVRVPEEAGLPPGVLNVVTTTPSAPVSGPVIADPRLRKLSFTGSTPVGTTLLRQAADNVLRTSMELGGNASFLVFEDADLAAAVEGAMLAKFRDIGEACTAANRFLVHENVADEFLERVTARVSDLVVGRGTEPGTAIGPLINTAAVTKVGRLVSDARRKPALWRCPAARPGDVLRPHGARRHRPWQRDPARGDLRPGPRGVHLRLDTGMMGLNVGALSNAAAPFGGVKHSGLGREGGVEGIAEYLETKYVVTATPRR